MSITVADDQDRVGYAILTLAEPRVFPLRVSIQFLDKSYLGPDGRRTRQRHLFEAAPRADSPDGLPAGDLSGHRFCLGPDVTAHVLEAEIVTLADGEGTPLGTVIWEGIRVLPGSGDGAPIGLTAHSSRKPPQRPPLVMGKAKPTDPKPLADPGLDSSGLDGSGWDGSGWDGSGWDDPSLDKPDADAPPPSTDPVVTPDPKPDRKRRLLLPLTLGFGFLVVLIALGLILTGTIGWAIEPAAVAFAGRAGGPFHPGQDLIRFERAWYVRPLGALLFGNRPPFVTATVPAWLSLRQEMSGSGAWTLTVAPAAQATRTLAPGLFRFQVPLTFPFKPDVPGPVVTLTIEPSNAPYVPPIRLPEPERPPQPVTLIDDVACDRVAGNRFDPDHPADRSFTEDVFALQPDDLDKGLAWCDPNPDRTGRDRRFMVQRGRLLVARALQRLAQGDIAGAQRDMDDAVAAWRRGAALGSAYADNLLGAYYKGTFNRAAHIFVEPDDAKADGFWLHAMQAGDIVAKRNYAAQLLSGKGVPADPERAMTLLREALAAGDERAAGVLGVALYTGRPPGVARDKAQGWALIKRTQCLDRTAADLMAQEIAAGRQPAADRQSCS